MFSFESRIRFSEVNESNQLNFASIINYFQDCSLFHSEAVGFGLDFFQKRKRAWLLSTWQINVLRFPSLFENVKISTYPYKIKSFMGYRNFAITGQNNELCVIADSSWIYIDTETKHPVRASKEEIFPHEPNEKFDMNYILNRIAVNETMRAEEPIKVLPSFIDSNHHVNNSQYVKLAENYLNRDFSADQLRVEYKMAATVNDMLYPKILTEQNKNIIAFYNESGKAYANIEFSNIGGQHVINR